MTDDELRLANVPRPLRVLVVDDEPRWRELLVDVIPDMGFAARGVRSAEEALALMEADQHDVLVLDLHLPAMGGLELFARVIERWPLTQAIVVTAYGELAAAQRAIRLRVAEFLTKPCHLADIEGALERARRLLCPMADGSGGSGPVDSAAPPRTPGDRAVTLKEAEQQAIVSALKRNQNNKAAAARELGISRRSLYDRLSTPPTRRREVD